MLGDRGVIPNIPMATNASGSSITKSGIAEGSITITKPSEQKQDVSQINRNTEGTANVLKNSFDSQKVQERQETAALFSEMAFNAIHELSHKRSGKQDGEISTWTTEERAMAHTLVGLISSEIAGSGNPMSTLTAAGVNALVVTALTRDAKAKEYFEKHPDQLQWASAVLGAAVAKTTGGSAQSGASIAASGTKNNWGNIRVEETLQKLDESQFVEQLAELTGKEPSEITTSIKSSIIKYQKAGRIDHIDAVMVSGSVGFGPTNGQIAGTYDIDTGKFYLSDGGSVGISGLPHGLELVGVQISTIDDSIDLTRVNTRKRIFSGKAYGSSAFCYIGGGIYIPSDSEFQNKVFLTTIGLGNSQLNIVEYTNTKPLEEVIQDVVHNRSISAIDLSSMD